MFFNTQIVLDLSSCKGIFTFEPDSFTSPGPCGLTGLNKSICSLDVNILINCKGDYKITLLDNNSCCLSILLLKWSQYKIQPINELNYGVNNLFSSTGKTHLIQINANNLNLMGEYISFEDAAYYYRRVEQNYLNLWCGAENNGFICNILGNTNNVMQAIINNPTTPSCSQSQTFTFPVFEIPPFSVNLCGLELNIETVFVPYPAGFSYNVTVSALGITGTAYDTLYLATPYYYQEFDNTIWNVILANYYYTFGPENTATFVFEVQKKSGLVESQFIYNLSQNLIKSRVNSLKQLCECGKVCNDQFLNNQKGPCSSFKYFCK